MSKKKSAKTEVAQEVETVDMSGHLAPPAVEEVEETKDPKRKVKMILPVQLRINRQLLGPGPVVVEAHQVDSIVEMVDKKKRADISIFTGNKYLVERLMDRTLVVKKVDNL